MLLDSNIIIYRGQGKIFKTLESSYGFASIITKIEVLGFTRLTEIERIDFIKFFNEIEILQITEEIAEIAIELKTVRKISIPDAIIASTALANKMPLVTANTKDFRWIDGLEIINPLEK